MVSISCKLFWDSNKYSIHISLGKFDNFVTFYLADGYNKFLIFYQKSERDYRQSMENTIVSEVSPIRNDDNDIKNPIPKQTGINIVWS